MTRFAALIPMASGDRTAVSPCNLLGTFRVSVGREAGTSSRLEVGGARVIAVLGFGRDGPKVVISKDH